MYPIATTLKVGNNQLDSYLPIRNKNNDINWQFVTGLVLSYALKRKIDAYTPSQFRDDCKAHLQELLDEPAFWTVLNGCIFPVKISFVYLRFFYYFMLSLMAKK